MNAVALATVNTALDPKTIAERIQGYVAKGWAPYPAAEAVIRDLCREGLAEQLLQQYVPAAFYEVWEESKRTQRGERKARADLGTRRVNVGLLKQSSSLLSSLVKVGDRWVRLGDLDRAALRQAARERKQAALAQAHYARFFHALAERVTGDWMVGQVLDEMAVQAIFEGARP